MHITIIEMALEFLTYCYHDCHIMRILHYSVNVNNILKIFAEYFDFFQYFIPIINLYLRNISQIFAIC